MDNNCCKRTWAQAREMSSGLGLGEHFAISNSFTEINHNNTLTQPSDAGGLWFTFLKIVLYILQIPVEELLIFVSLLSCEQSQFMQSTGQIADNLQDKARE